MFEDPYMQDFVDAQTEYRRNKFNGGVTADAENRMNQAMANSWNQEAANQWSAQQAALRNAPEENPLQGLHQKYVLGPSRGSNILSSDDPDGSKRAAARERYNQFATGNGTLGTEDQFLNDPRVMAMTAPQRDQAFQMMYGKTPQQYSEVKHYGDIFNAHNQDKINAWNKQREALVAENSQFGPQRQDLNQRILDLNAAGQPLRKQFDYNDLARLGADHKRAFESLKQFEEQTGVPFLQGRGMYKDGVLTIPAKTKDDGYGNIIQIAPERKIPIPQAYMDSVAQQFNLLNPNSGVLSNTDMSKAANRIAELEQKSKAPSAAAARAVEEERKKEAEKPAGLQAREFAGKVPNLVTGAMDDATDSNALKVGLGSLNPYNNAYLPLRAAAANVGNFLATATGLSKSNPFKVPDIGNEFVTYGVDPTSFSAPSQQEIEKAEYERQVRNAARRGLPPPPPPASQQNAVTPMYQYRAY